jgi:hypothetical protein
VKEINVLICYLRGWFSASVDVIFVMNTKIGREYFWSSIAPVFFPSKISEFLENLGMIAIDASRKPVRRPCRFQSSITGPLPYICLVSAMKIYPAIEFSF